MGEENEDSPADRYLNKNIVNTGRSNNKTPTKIIVCLVTSDVHWLMRCMVLHRDKEKALNHSV